LIIHVSFEWVREMIEAFVQAIPLIDRIEQAGYEAYFVGGSVRDYLLNKDIADVDIATSATPEEIKGIFPKTVDVGIEHGTVVVLFQGLSYEITTFRSESEYEDFRRPKDVQFIRSLFEDLKRRDFTMNAIAMDRNGQFIDPFHGAEAIQHKRIQTVGDPRERFSEDALRIMRAIRFVSQLSFSLEVKTLHAVKDYGHLLEKISVERKTKEFEKILSGKNRRKSIHLLVETGLQSFLPGLEKNTEELMKLTSIECEKLQLIEMWSLLLFTLNISSGEGLTFLKSWRLSNQKMKVVIKLLSALENRLLAPWSELSLYQAGEEIAISAERIYQVLNRDEMNDQINKLKKRYGDLAIKKRGDLVITGQELMIWMDRSGGPWVKEILEQIEKAVLLKEVPNAKESIREWINTCNQK
jgi:tRNA nucleotidyltransferase (CCA-adding enzyme)